MMFGSRTFEAREAGFSLIEVIIGVGLLCVVGYGFSQVVVSNMDARNNVDAENAYQEIEPALQTVLTQSLRTYMTAPSPCRKAFAINVPFGAYTITSMSSLAGVMRAPSAGFNATATRCRTSPRLGLLGNPSNAYFCLNFTRAGSGLMSGSFTGSRSAFAEVLVRTQNLQTGNPETCDAFADAARGPMLNASGSGAAIYYTMYWLVEHGIEQRLMRRNGFFFLTVR